MHESSPKVINAIVEIPKDTSAKYEYNADLDTFQLDRCLPSSMKYPCSYGFVPSTLAEDDDPLDILIYNNVPIERGTIVECNVIGALDMGMSRADFNKATASAWVHAEWLGFDHWKAIRSITITNAEALRIEKSKGLISEGFDADVVFYNNDPSANIRNLVFNPAHVIKNGEIVF